MIIVTISVDVPDDPEVKCDITGIYHGFVDEDHAIAWADGVQAEWGYPHNVHFQITESLLFDELPRASKPMSRDVAMALRFGKLYGTSTESMMVKTNISKERAAEIYKNFEKRYPGIIKLNTARESNS